MDFDTYLSDAWNRHAEHPETVAAELATTGLALAVAAGPLARLSQLAQHVHGEHLGRWAEGLDFQARLAALPAVQSDADAHAAVQRASASLRLCAGEPARADGLPAAEQVRALALAAASLAPHDLTRAMAMFRAALDAARALPEDGPHARTVAAAANNLAVTLESRTPRSAEERALMILAAQTARRCWAIAGGWLETERADYRLAMTWLQAGDPAQARVHAQACLDRVVAHGSEPLELFFAQEALARAEHAGGDALACAQAVASAHATFATLGEGDRGWVRPSLDALPRG
jgi:hypothetical protein